MKKISRFEKARLISARALQISLGAPTFVKAPKNLSIFEIAKLEFSKKVVPMSILRKMPSGDIEKMDVF